MQGALLAATPAYSLTVCGLGSVGVVGDICWPMLLSCGLLQWRSRAVLGADVQPTSLPRGAARREAGSRAAPLSHVECCCSRRCYLTAVGHPIGDRRDYFPAVFYFSVLTYAAHYAVTQVPTLWVRVQEPCCHWWAVIFGKILDE